MKFWCVVLVFKLFYSVESSYYESFELLLHKETFWNDVHQKQTLKKVWTTFSAYKHTLIPVLMHYFVSQEIKATKFLSYLCRTKPSEKISTKRKIKVKS